jgi:transcriptional regulator with XRE-family HTH domain
MRKKKVEETDAYIGARIRQRRMQLHMSQETLGDGLGLTFQQVQKYEKGTNRVGGSRMIQIATVLKVQPAYFFEGASGHAVDDDADKDVSAFVTSRDGLSIIKSWPMLPPTIRRTVTDTLEAVAKALH